MKAPDFSLTNVRTQETWSLTDAGDHAMMLTFWTSWCPDSINDKRLATKTAPL
ncbi:redoxin domain-containing protein [Shouchella shacheensis]|uniref:redoxin domain-containing protein n=1 Tax=Shouchella shacheensis TaxID=1649580 RepID=UPI0015D5DA5D|nr:redoxin domain-containing protein [Shouchella shacheensis]